MIQITYTKGYESENIYLDSSYYIDGNQYEDSSQLFMALSNSLRSDSSFIELSTSDHRRLLNKSFIVGISETGDFTTETLEEQSRIALRDLTRTAIAR